MLVQMALGAAMIVLSVVVAGAFLLIATNQVIAAAPWLQREPHGMRFMALLIAVTLWVQAGTALVVALWAWLFMALGLFGEFEAALYFALVSFTTLGFGDVLLPEDWRLLSGFAAANGFLLFGLFTAFLAETMRRIRLEQIAGRGLR